MIKKIKKYFLNAKLKKQLKKEIQHEILETLATICLYLENDGRRKNNPYGRYMNSHFKELKVYSEILRDDLNGDIYG